MKEQSQSCISGLSFQRNRALCTKKNTGLKNEKGVWGHTGQEPAAAITLSLTS